jgi:hypothetical protein
VTSKAPGNPGVLLQVAGFTHGESAGMLVQNVSRGSWAFIDSVTGPGVATMTQPLATAGLTTITANPVATPLAEDNGWAASNTLQVYTLPLLNLKTLDPQGGDATVSFTAPAVWVQYLHIPDVTGTPGFSEFAPTSDGCGLVMSGMWVDPYLFATTANAGASGTIFMNSFLNGGCQLEGSYEFANASVISGSVNTAKNTNLECEGHTILSGDVIVHGTTVPGSPNVSFIASPNYVQAYFDANVIAAARYGGGTLVLQDNFLLGPGTGHPVLWGPATLGTEPPLAAICNETGDTWVHALTVGSTTLDGASTGTSYAGGVWTDGVSVTTAHLDSDNGLQNPRTGSRYSTN